MAGSQMVEVTEMNFEQEVLKSEKPVLVDFWAEWCGPCRMIAPAVEQIANEYEGRARVVKLDVDKNLGITTRYQIRSIPTLLIFKNGQIQEQLVGAQSKDVISRMLEKHL